MCFGGGGACSPSLEVISAACAGDGSEVPWIDSSGLELSNTFVYDVGGQYGSTCNLWRDSYAKATVGRSRSTYCPRGYTRVTGGYCRRSSLDPVKNLGKQCPTCGNPISLGIGNKFQEELDYSSGGAFKLEFRRYYNSQFRTKNNISGYWNLSSYTTTFGAASLTTLSGLPDLGPLYRNLGLDLVGQNWRHFYQRNIHFPERGIVKVATAFAFRHDGRALAFTYYAGTYRAQDDVADTLERTTSVCREPPNARCDDGVIT
jgi:hypothetical protein